MKLVNKEKVLDKLKELFSYAIVVDITIPINENEGIGMGDIVQEIDDLESLSPAELADENLKALAVLEQPREYLGQGLKRQILHHISTKEVIEMVLCRIADLESQAPVSELVGILEGDSWIVREFEKELQQRVDRESVSPVTYSSLLGLFRHFKSQAPTSDLAELKENERKARFLDRLCEDPIYKDKINELLAEEEKR